MISKLRKSISQYKLLMLSDANLPSVVSVITGDRLKGSWWAHPEGAKIYNASTALEDDPDVLVCKLINRKVTFVHRDLWPFLFSIALSNESWQTNGLAAAARSLYKRIQKNGESVIPGTPAERAAAKELEYRLLALSKDVHTESGKHIKLLSSWSKEAESRNVNVSADVSSAKRSIELSVQSFATDTEIDTIKLPWTR